MKSTVKGMSKAPSQRQLRVAEEVRHVLGKMLSQEDLFIDGLKSSFIMITQVTISPDLSYATAFVETVGDTNVDEQIALLNKHKGVFRYRIGKSVRLRIVPDIIFKADQRFAVSNHINELLNTPQVRADVEKEISEEDFE